MRLVDADELIKFGWEMHRPVVNVLGVRSYEIASLEQVKEVDAIHVVRCKDCKWWKTNYFWNGTERKVCVIEPYEPCRNPNDYCSRGERKDGADDD